MANRAANYEAMSRIGEKLRTLRHRKGLTSRELGQALGVSNAYIIQIENGLRRPSIDLVGEISRFFKVSADILIKDELELDD